MFTITAKSTARKTVCKMSFGHISRQSNAVIVAVAIQNGCGPYHPQNPHLRNGMNIIDTSTANPMANNVRLIGAHYINERQEKLAKTASG